jgi:hypothetical protein
MYLFVEFVRNASFLGHALDILMNSSARPDVVESSPPPSCPRLSRASTSFLFSFSEQGVDGRDKLGQDSGEMVQFDRNPL